MKLLIPVSITVIRMAISGVLLSAILGSGFLTERTLAKAVQDDKSSSGAKLYRSGKVDQAIAVLNKRVKSHPDDLSAHYYLGLSYYKSKKANLAYKHLKIVAAKNPGSKIGKYSLFLMGRILAASKKIKKSDGFVGLKFKKQRIVRVYSGSPAETAGVKVLDKIISVDNIPVEGLTKDEIAKLIIGPIGTIVVVKVKRAGRAISFKLKRGKIYRDAERMWIK